MCVPACAASNFWCPVKINSAPQTPAVRSVDAADLNKTMHCYIFHYPYICEKNNITATL